MENTTFVKSSSEFPSWKNPCPKCGSRWERGKESGISTKKDGTGAWCKKCKHNWKFDPRPQGWDKTAESLGAKTDFGKDDTSKVIESLASRLTMLEAIVNGSKGMGVVGIDERLGKLEAMVKNDNVVFYPKDDIDVKKIPF